MDFVRSPVKRGTTENQNRWRDRFRKECGNRIKNARQEKIDSLRESKWMQYTLPQEWADFKKRNEEAMLREGVTDMDDLIEESLREEYDEYLRQEQEELEYTVKHSEQACLICVHCLKGSLIYQNSSMLSCSRCGFYATESCLQTALNVVNQHSAQCQGRIEFSLELGTNNTLVANCDLCGLWDMFYILLDDMLPLLLKVDTRAAAYDVIVTLEVRLDPDQLLGELINKIVCFEWNSEKDETKCMETAMLFVIYIELFGKSLEKLKRSKEWMLYLPFLTNFLKRTLDFIEPILIEKSCLSHRERPSSGWDQMILLIVEITLEFAHFVHAVTVQQSPMEFPVTSTDIGSEGGDVKRRYLGYFLLNSIFEKVVLNFDMQLSKSYYENRYPKYNLNRPNTHNENTTHSEYTSRIIQQCTELSALYGYTYDRMLQLLNNINENQVFNFLSAG
ncbi:hypothetical protein G6F56_004919 [Rhizopus delemar]|nr:hypothetical protein G6F56_004919 [Rhizopus delemar]